MKLAVLIRGFNFLEEDRCGYPMDARQNVESLVEKLIDPVRAASPEANIYLVTYDSPALAEVVKALEPCKLILLDAEGSSQVETYKEGLQHVFANDDCDAVIVTRFDLAFRKSFDEWNVTIDDETIYFPWKEYLACWRDYRRVGDAVHIVGRRVMPFFYSAMTMTQIAQRKDFHLLYYFLRTMWGKLKFIEEGYWDSNTLYANPEYDNPLYRIFNRPKLTEYEGTNLLLHREIKAE